MYIYSESNVASCLRYLTNLSAWSRHLPETAIMLLPIRVQRQLRSHVTYKYVTSESVCMRSIYFLSFIMDSFCNCGVSHNYVCFCVLFRQTSCTNLALYRYACIYKYSKVHSSSLALYRSACCCCCL